MKGRLAYMCKIIPLYISIYILKHVSELFLTNEKLLNVYATDAFSQFWKLILHLFILSVCYKR